MRTFREFLEEDVPTNNASSGAVSLPADAVYQKKKNPYDGRTKDAKKFFTRMEKRRNQILKNETDKGFAYKRRVGKPLAEIENDNGMYHVAMYDSKGAKMRMNSYLSQERAIDFVEKELGMVKKKVKK